MKVLVWAQRADRPRRPGATPRLNARGLFSVIDAVLRTSMREEVPMTDRQMNTKRGSNEMKIIGSEEHYGLPSIYDAAIKAGDPYGLIVETLKKAGHFPVPADPQAGF